MRALLCVLCVASWVACILVLHGIVVAGNAYHMRMPEISLGYSTKDTHEVRVELPAGAYVIAGRRSMTCEGDVSVTLVNDDTGTRVFHDPAFFGLQGKKLMRIDKDARRGVLTLITPELDLDSGKYGLTIEERWRTPCDGDSRMWMAIPLRLAKWRVVTRVGVPLAVLFGACGVGCLVMAAMWGRHVGRRLARNAGENRRS